MDEDTARTRLDLMIDTSSDPAIADHELDEILDSARRVDAAGNPFTNVDTAPTWEPSTVYQYGAVVTADPAGGRWWLCTTPGTSGTTQPSWPDQGTQAPFLTTVSEDGVVWTDAGTAWAPTWDLNAAAAEGWRIKAGRAAGRFNFTTDGQTFARSQVIAHCRAQERSYRRKIVGG